MFIPYFADSLPQVPITYLLHIDEDDHPAYCCCCRLLFSYYLLRNICVTCSATSRPRARSLVRQLCDLIKKNILKRLEVHNTLCSFLIPFCAVTKVLITDFYCICINLVVIIIVWILACLLTQF